MIQLGGNRKGLAVPAAILIVAMLSSAIDHLSIWPYRSGALRNRHTQTDWLLQAALNRAAKALTTPGDPMRQALFEDRSFLWRFSDRKLLLGLEVESEKIDINRADGRLITSRLSHILAGVPSGTMERIAERLADVRGRQGIWPSPETLLPIKLRFGFFGEAVKRETTVFSGQRRPSPALMRHEEGTLDELSGLDGSRREAADASSFLTRPVYRLTASLVDEGSAETAQPRAAILILSANDQTAFRIVDGHL